MRIARLLKRLDCTPGAVSTRSPIDGALAQVGVFATDRPWLSRFGPQPASKNSWLRDDILPRRWLKQITKNSKNYSATAIMHKQT